jgi:hypothetical protein
MQQTSLFEGSRDTLPGEVVFASMEEQAQRSAELLGAGALLVTLPPPGVETRGRLGELLEELVERELARMGAPSPYLAAWSAMPEDAQARLADQLFRARTVGATGLAIAMGTLRGIGEPALSVDDSATLRWLAKTTEDAPVVLMLDDGDLRIAGYGAPVALERLVRDPREEAAKRLVEEWTERTSSWPPPADPEPVELTGDDATTNDTVVAPIEMAAPPVITAPEPEPEPEPIPQAKAEPIARKVPTPEAWTPAHAWRSWAMALSAARGAQPLAAFERLFTENYVPLANAITRGLEDPRATRAYDEFRRSFERTYTEAFTAFGATNRRPKLVMDAHDIAAKQARLANARSTHVLMVDSMRFDIGCAIRNALATEVAGAATLSSEMILWSALPTTTTRQLETFARGLDALRAPAHEEPAESLRGRAAEVVRRLRVGSREVYKLDLIPSLLDSTPLDEIAQATAEAIARHISTLTPRTLLFIVGDHGFGIDRRGEIQTGGASPEEVLVPAFTWLVGELH